MNVGVDPWGMPLPSPAAAIAPPPRPPTQTQGQQAPIVSYVPFPVFQPTPQQPAPTPQSDNFIMNVIVVLFVVVVCLAFMAGSNAARSQSIETLVKANHEMVARLMVALAKGGKQAVSQELPPRISA